ncbi:MAG: DUF2079 domain-containing protein, partial [Chloroflexota bacterium]|nr:DUF2079 domain-containing protein [Chloroflexota bacterium]
MIALPAQSLHAYQAFGSYPDFGDFDQSLVSLLQGGSIGSVVNFSRRFNPVMFVLVPLYVLWRDPRSLLLLQSLGIAAALFPLYWIARRQIGRLLALVLALSYLLSSSVHGVNNPVFYEIKLAIPLFAFAIFFLLRERYVPFLVCIGVSLLLKEEVGFVVIGFAAFIFFVQRKRLLGLSIAISGAALALFVIEFLYPFLNQGRPYPLFDERYAYLGHSLGEVMFSLIRRPDVVLQHVWVPPKIEFVLQLLVPVAFLPIVGAEIAAIALPSWLYTLLSELGMQFDINQYYQSPLVPFIFFGALVGMRRLLEWRRASQDEKETSRRKFALTALLVVSSQLYLPGTWARVYDPGALTLDQHDALGYTLLKGIPVNTTVVAQTEFYVPLFAEHQQRVLEFSPRGDYRQVDYMFGDSTRFWYSFHQTAWEQWLASGYFEPVVEQDGYFLL